jgi:hypothetical protein
MLFLPLFEARIKSNLKEKHDLRMPVNHEWRSVLPYFQTRQFLLEEPIHLLEDAITLIAKKKLTPSVLRNHLRISTPPE